MATRKYTELERRYVRRYYPHVEAQVLADKLNRTLWGIYGVARQLGVGKSAAFMLAQSERVKNNHATRFKPGHVPHNKGKRHFAPGMEKHWFKKGIVPHNKKKIGSTRVDTEGYVLKKITESKWELLHKLVWAEAYGSYNTKTHCLWFKNGNTQDVRLENLELITRAESMSRTHNEDNFIISKYLGVKDKKRQQLIKENLPGMVKLKRAELLIKKKLRNETTGS